MRANGLFSGRVAGALLGLFLLLSLAPAARSQDAEPARGWGPPVPVRPVVLNSAAIRIDVRGQVASTTVELQFYNPNYGLALEGELVFPLGPGQTVSGHALDLNGFFREGVAISKDRARVVFETLVRGRIDPSLVELTRGNLFRTRVYPIFGPGYRRLTYSFDQELVAGDSGDRYVLPLHWSRKLDQFQIDLDVRGRSAAPRSEERPGPGAIDLPMPSRQDGGFSVRKNLPDFRPSQPLILHFPRTGSVAGAEFAADDQPPGGQFLARLELPAGLAPALPKPRRVALFYDASASASERERGREKAALAAWFRVLGEVTVDLVPFHVEAERTQTFVIRRGDSRALLAALEALPFDGATSLGAIDARRAPQADFAVVVSDGLHTLGPSEPHWPGPGPLFVLHASQVADHDRLARLCRGRGGRVIDLLQLERAEAVQALSRAPLALLGWSVLRGRLGEFTRAAGEPVTGRVFTLGGRSEDGAGELEVRFGSGQTVLSTQRVGIDPARALPPERARVLRRLCAQQLLTSLARQEAPPLAQIQAQAQAAGLVSRSTSLLVLETLDDYVRYRVPPPGPEMLEQYRVRLAEQTPAAAAEAAPESHLPRVLREWEVFKAWHDRSGPALGAETLKVTPRPWSPPAEQSARPTEQQTSNVTIRPAPPPAILPGTGGGGGIVTGSYIPSDENFEPVRPGELPAVRRQSPLGRLRTSTNPYATFREDRGAQLDDPGYILEAAAFFRARDGDARREYRVLSNLAESAPDNPAALRVLAWQLTQSGRHEVAAEVLEEVLVRRPEEPQSRRDLAHALLRLPKPDPRRAARLLAEIVTGRWDRRFPGIEGVALHELLALIERLPPAERPDLTDLGLDPAALGRAPVGLRVVLTWSTDDTDIDLWLTGPSGTSSYKDGHVLRVKDGHLSADYSSYGPEVFTLRRPEPGTYVVSAFDRRSSRRGPLAATTVRVEFQTDFGGPNQRTQTALGTLRQPGMGAVEIGRFTVP